MSTDTEILVNRARGLVAYRTAAALDGDDIAAVLATEALSELPPNIRDTAWVALVQRAEEADDLPDLLVSEMQGARVLALVNDGEAGIVAGAEALLAEPPANPGPGR